MRPAHSPSPAVPLQRLPAVEPATAGGWSASRFAGWLTFAFVVLAGFVISRHEFWRDELQSWLLARDSLGIIDLLSRQRYEGHPALWQLLLLPLTRLFGTPAAMQVLHLTIAAATVYLVARWSPFTRLQKVLFSFGYFPFYEYAVISRSYGLGLLLLVTFCALYPHRHRRFLAIAAILFLLCHTHALTLIVALVLTAGLVGEFAAARRVPSGEGEYEPRTFAAGLILIGIGGFTALRQIIPPSDTGVAVGWRFEPGLDALAGALRNLTSAYVPLPKWDANFWNHPILFERPYGPGTWIVSALVAAYAGFLTFHFFRRAFAAWVFATGSLGLLVFFHVKYAGAARHHGLLFVLLLMAAWLFLASPPPVTSARPGERRWNRVFRGSLTFLFGLHAVAGCFAAVADVARPFSRAGAVADYLRRDGYADSLLVGHVDYTTVGILGHSPQRQIYYPQSGRWGSYTIWDQRRLAELTAAEIVAAARALPRPPDKRVILILNHRLAEGLASSLGLAKRAEFTGAIVEDENFFLYELGPPP